MNFLLRCGHRVWVQPWESWLRLIHKPCAECLRADIERRHNAQA